MAVLARENLYFWYEQHSGYGWCEGLLSYHVGLTVRKSVVMTCAKLNESWFCRGPRTSDSRFPFMIRCSFASLIIPASVVRFGSVEFSLMFLLCVPPVRDGRADYRFIRS